MLGEKILYKPVQGKTYSLFAEGGDSERYFTEIKHLADHFLLRCPDADRLLSLIQKAGNKSFLLALQTTGADRKFLRFIRETLKQSLSIIPGRLQATCKACPWQKGWTKRSPPRKINTTCICWRSS